MNSIFEITENGDIDQLKRIIKELDSDEEIIQLVNSQEQITAKSPLHIAAKLGYFDICQCLQQNGAELDILDIEDKTPLHYAAKADSFEICQFFVDEGANIDAKDVSI